MKITLVCVALLLCACVKEPKKPVCVDPTTGKPATSGGYVYCYAPGEKP